MDNLDDLTNDELRLRLLENGLPNLPVTSTTRNVLVKKLRNILNNEKTKNRRETIHVASYSSADDSDAADVIVAAANRKVGPKNRRATMVPISTASIAKPAAAAPPPTPAAAVEPLAVEKNTNTRRSGRITPTTGVGMVNSSSKVSAAAPPLIVDLIEESDEDEEEALNSKHRELLKRKPSKSRTPEKQKPATTTRRSVSKSKEFVQPPPPAQQTSKKPEIPKIIEEQEDDAYTFKSTFGSSTSSKIPLHSWDKYKDIPSISSVKSIYQSSTVGASTSSYSTSSYKPYSELNYAAGSKYSAEEKEAAYQKDREEEEDGGVELQTPYLNKFSKRLSELSAEPLLSSRSGGGTYQRRNTESAPGRHNIYSYRTSEYQSTGSENDGWNPSKVVVTTEQKLRWVFWPIVAILLILFLYFMFFV